MIFSDVLDFSITVGMMYQSTEHVQRGRRESDQLRSIRHSAPYPYAYAPLPGKPAVGLLGIRGRVLPGETTSGYLSPRVILRRELYPAMERAGIARIGPTGEKRTFHSLRHTFARLAIEHNRPIFWPSKHLGTRRST